MEDYLESRLFEGVFADQDIHRGYSQPVTKPNLEPITTIRPTKRESRYTPPKSDCSCREHTPWLIGESLRDLLVKLLIICALVVVGYWCFNYLANNIAQRVISALSSLGKGAV